MTQIEQSITSIRQRVALPKEWGNFGQSYGALAGLVVLVLFDLIFTRQFRSLFAIDNILIQTTPTLIVAVGMTLVIATGGIDISVGSIMAIAGVLAYNIFSGSLFGIHNTFLANVVAIVFALLVATLAGAFNGVLVTRFRVQPIVATLILLISGRGIAEVLEGTQHSFLGLPFDTAGNTIIFNILSIQVLIMVVIVAIFAWLMSATSFSRYLLAAGGNQSAARLAGVPVTRVLITVYLLSGLLAGIAGLISMSYTKAVNPFHLGLGFELNAIAAVAVGGTPLTGGRATIFGTVIGAIFIQLIHGTVVSLNVPDDIANIIVGVIIVLAVYLQRQRTA